MFVIVDWCCLRTCVRVGVCMFILCSVCMMIYDDMIYILSYNNNNNNYISYIICHISCIAYYIHHRSMCYYSVCVCCISLYLSPLCLYVTLWLYVSLCRCVYVYLQ